MKKKRWAQWYCVDKSSGERHELSRESVRHALRKAYPNCGGFLREVEKAVLSGDNGLNCQIHGLFTYHEAVAKDILCGDEKAPALTGEKEGTNPDEGEV
jgi:hypothetical protein